VGFASYVSDSAFSPLLVSAGIFMPVLGVVLLSNPILALKFAIFIFLTPGQIIRLIPVTLLADYAPVLAQLVACISFLINILVYRRRIVWTQTAIFILLFLVWSTITLFWAENLSIAYVQLLSHVIGLTLVLLIVNEVNSPSRLNGMMRTLARINWLLLVACLGTAVFEGYSFGTRLSVLGLNPNSLGPLVLVTMPGALWQTTSQAGNWKTRKLPGLILYFFLVISLVAMSGSRGSAISILITFLLFIFWKSTRTWGVLALTILILAVLIVPSIFSSIQARFTILPEDTLLGGREVIWHVTWRLIRDNPWLGVGIGNAPYAIMPNLRLYRSILGMESAAIHNPILAIWAETGTLGLMLYLGILASAIFSFLVQYHRSRTTSSQILKFFFPIIAAAFAGYMLSWIKSGSVEASYNYYLMLALLLVPSVLKAPEAGTEDVK
jgi:O-antigen ligase